MSERISKEDYEAIQQLLISQGRIFVMLDIEGFIEAIDRAETVGPFIDPTLFRTASDRLELVKTLAYGALAFKNAVIAAEEKRLRIMGEEKST